MNEDKLVSQDMEQKSVHVLKGDALDFRTELMHLLNRFNMESRSNTPDMILRDFICDALRAFDTAVNQRENWYGRRKSDDRT